MMISKGEIDTKMNERRKKKEEEKKTEKICSIGRHGNRIDS